MTPTNSAAPVASGGRQFNRQPHKVYAAPTLIATFDDLAIEAQSVRAQCEIDLVGYVLSRPRDGWAQALQHGLQLQHFIHEDTLMIAGAIDVLHRIGRLGDVGIDFQQSRVIHLARRGLEDRGMGWYWPQHELIHLSRKYRFDASMVVMHVEQLIDLGVRIADAERALRYAYHRLLGRKGAA